MCKISVIIPVYNCEAFLSRCLDSLLAQSHSDWEAVCVNDGSKDGSAGILDRYAEADKRFKVIHKENGGVSQARNLALEKAEMRGWMQYAAIISHSSTAMISCILRPWRYAFISPRKTIRTLSHSLTTEDTGPELC